MRSTQGKDSNTTVRSYLQKTPCNLPTSERSRRVELEIALAVDSDVAPRGKDCT